MFDFAGKELKLGDSVVTETTGRSSSFVAGEVIKLTENGAKIATAVEMRDGQVWRRSVTLQRQSHIIALIARNPEREAELSAK